GAQSYVEAAYLHAALIHLAVLIDHVDELLPLVGAQGLLGNQQRLVRLADRQADANVQAGVEGAVGVLEDGAQPPGAGVRIDAVVGEVDLAAPRELALLVRQAQKQRQRVVRVPLDLALAHQALGLERAALVQVEVGVDRVQRDDGGQGRLVRLDHVPRVDEAAADAPALRCLDLGEFDVEFGEIAGGLRDFEGALRLLKVADDAVELLAGDGALARQVHRPPEVQLQALQAALGLGDGPLGAGQLGRVGPGVDFKEQVALLDLGPFLEVGLFEVAGHAGADLDGVLGLDAAREVLVVGDLLDDGQADGDLGRLLR